MEALSQYWAAFFIGVATLGGMGGLFLWGWMRGAFKNPEGPKHRMLELERTTEVKL